MSAPGVKGRVVYVLVAALLATAAGIGALIGAAATTDRPPLFLLAGLLVFCATYYLGLLLATRGVSSTRRRRARAVLFCAVTAAVAGTFAWTALLPMNDPRLPPAPVQGQRFWNLPTGSRIAYVRVPAEGDARKTPVVFLHGGPGVPDMKGDLEYFGRLANDGSGHNAFQDEPERYMANVRAFLLGRPLPRSPYQGYHMPDDYEGPP